MSKNALKMPKIRCHFASHPPPLTHLLPLFSSFQFISHLFILFTITIKKNPRHKTQKNKHISANVLKELEKDIIYNRLIKYEYAYHLCWIFHFQSLIYTYSCLNIPCVEHERGKMSINLIVMTCATKQKKFSQGKCFPVPSTFFQSIK